MAGAAVTRNTPDTLTAVRTACASRCLRANTAPQHLGLMQHLQGVSPGLERLWLPTMARRGSCCTGLSHPL